MAFPKIYVGGLSLKTTSDDLRRYFERFGEVVDANVVSESSTAESKGYGFVRFKDDESAARALENRNQIIDGSIINCEHAKDNQPKQNDSMAFPKIFVGNLSEKTTRDDLKRYFQPLGEMVNAYIIYKSGRSKCYGFVTFRNVESAARALENPNPIINGKKVICQHTQPKQKGNSSDQAGPSHQKFSRRINTQQYQPMFPRPINMPHQYQPMFPRPINMQHQYQPSPLYYPPWFWDPVTGLYYYLCYNNPVYPYPTPMSYNQDRTNNIIQQNDETEQGNTVIVDNANKITIVDCDDGDEEDGDIKQDADTTKELDNEAVERRKRRKTLKPSVFQCK